jgi:hypothetical protein
MKVSGCTLRESERHRKRGQALGPSPHIVSCETRSVADLTIITIVAPKDPLSTGGVYEATESGATDPWSRFRAARGLSAKIGWVLRFATSRAGSTDLMPPVRSVELGLCPS